LTGVSKLTVGDDIKTYCPPEPATAFLAAANSQADLLAIRR
jgi:hypothetical protein